MAGNSEKEALLWISALEAVLAAGAADGEPAGQGGASSQEEEDDAEVGTPAIRTRTSRKGKKSKMSGSGRARKDKSGADDSDGSQDDSTSAPAWSEGRNTPEPSAATSGGDAELDDEADGASATEYVEAFPPHTVTHDEVHAVVEEEIDGANKSVAMELLKQVRPGMDLSRVVLPTFILEPRSMLEKLSDFFSHTELLLAVPKVQDPVQRMVAVLRWYFSGFYIRPKGVKKPYNPIIGETFRCAWDGDDVSADASAGRTYLIAEQTSHHPPISCFYVTNRACGVAVSGAIKFGSSFYGTYTRALLKGYMTLVLTGHDGEEYTVTFPDTDAKGFIVGPLTMELVGKTQIKCAATGLVAEFAFKAKPMMWGEYNVVTGAIKRIGQKSPLYTIDGKWDRKLTLKDANTKAEEVLFDPVGRTRRAMLKPTWDEMDDFESNKLWKAVGEAIIGEDQVAATDEKHKLEEDQRAVHKRLKETATEWEPKLFEKVAGGSYDPEDANRPYVYRYENFEPFDPSKEGPHSLVESKGVLKVAPAARGGKKSSRSGGVTTPQRKSTSASKGGSSDGRKSSSKSKGGASSSSLAAGAVVENPETGSSTAKRSRRKGDATGADEAGEAVVGNTAHLEARIVELETKLKSLVEAQARHAAIVTAGAGSGSTAAVSMRSALFVLIVALYLGSAYNLFRWAW